MDNFKRKLSTLRIEVDHAIERAEAAERRSKTLEQQLLEKEQEVKSLTHSNGILEVTLEKMRNSLRGLETNHKDLLIKSEHHERQVRRLEQERDAMEAKYEEAVKKYEASQAELAAFVQSLETL